MIRRIGALALVLSLFGGCASVKDFQEADGCRVWRDAGVLGYQRAIVAKADDGQMRATMKGRCLFGWFVCKETWVYFKNGSEIRMGGNPIGSLTIDSKIADFKGGKLLLPGMGSLRDETDVTIKESPVVVEKTNSIAKSLSSKYEFEYNKKCNKPDVALAIALMYTDDEEGFHGN